MEPSETQRKKETPMARMVETEATLEAQTAGFLGRLLVASVASVAATVAVAGLAAPSASAVAALSCGSTVTTNVTLTSDITGCPGDGLVVGASNITVDLNGHTLSGSGSGSNTGSGINASGNFESVTVTNGSVKGFNRGVFFKSPNGGAVTNLTITSSVQGIVLNANAVKVVDNVLVGTDAPGGMGILVSGKENHVVSNTSRGFRFAAIFLTDSSAGTSVDANTMSTAGWGIYVQGLSQKVTNNLTHHNSNAGIVFDRQHCTDFNGCFPGATGTVSKNRADSNGLDGIQLLNSGISVGSNTASYNAGHGITAVSGVTDLSGNHAASNQTNPQCVNVACS